MKKHIYFVVICLIVVNNAFAQYGEEKNCLTYDVSGKVPQSEINALHDVVMNYYCNNANYYPQYDSVRYLDIFRVSLDDSIPYDSDLIKNGEFLNHIAPAHLKVSKHNRKRFGLKRCTKELLHNEVILYDTQNTPIMEFYFFETPRLDKNSCEAVLDQKIEEYGIVSVYHIEGKGERYLIGINENREVFFLRRIYLGNTVKVYPAKEFPKGKYPDLFP